MRGKGSIYPKQQRRKRNDDEPHLVDKIDARLFFLQKPAYKKRRA